MFAIKGFDHIVLRTTQMNEMLQFYCDVLHCIIEREQPDYGLVHLRAGDNLIDLLSIEGEQAEGRNLEHFCLRVSPFDYEAMEKYFLKNNITPKRLGERYGAQGLGYSFYINDPEENEIELCELK